MSRFPREGLKKLLAQFPNVETLMCRDAGVPVFVKQLGAKAYCSVSKASMGAGGVGLALKSKAGSDASEWPADLRVRQFPEVQP